MVGQINNARAQRQSHTLAASKAKIARKAQRASRKSHSVSSEKFEKTEKIQKKKIEIIRPSCLSTPAPSSSKITFTTLNTDGDRLSKLETLVGASSTVQSKSISLKKSGDKLLKGVCVSTKLSNSKTIIVRREYLKYIVKSERYEKRHHNIAANISPALKVKEGDLVVIAPFTKVSKKVNYKVLKVSPSNDKPRAMKLPRF